MGIRLNDEASAIIAEILLQAKLRQLHEQQEAKNGTEPEMLKQEA